MNPNPLLDTDTADGFIQATELLSPQGIPALGIYDTRFWSDYAIAPSYEFPYSFPIRPRVLERVFQILKVFRKTPGDYEDVREFCELAQGVYDILITIKR